jgi:Mrp family chromosome partitioning ATPase
MSRNYELLTEFESELGPTESRDANGVAHAASKAVVPSVPAAGDEEMQQLVRRIFLSPDENTPRAVVFCGVDAQNSSSSVCARAAWALAVHNRGRVCLVDANLRSPRLSGMFESALLPMVAASATPIVERCGQIEGNLWLAGPGVLAPNRTTLPPVEELKEVLLQLRSVFDYVLIDVPGTNVCGHAQLLGSVADAAILVVEANNTRRLSARNAQRTLATAGVRLLGTVLHNRSFPIPEQIYKRL